MEKDTCTPVFIAALFTIARTWKQPRCPSTDEWIKMWSLYTMECYSAIKNEWNSVICRDMDEPRVSYTAWSKSEREKQILRINMHIVDFPGGSDGKVSVYNAGDPGLIPGSGRSLEKEMATHSSTITWKIPWTEEPGRLQSTGLQRVGHDWATSLTHSHGVYKNGTDELV